MRIPVIRRAGHKLAGNKSGANRFSEAYVVGEECNGQSAAKINEIGDLVIKRLMWPRQRASDLRSARLLMTIGSISDHSRPAR